MHKDQILKINPPKFDCADDMAMLMYLNDACILWNSVIRYKNELIYTYSGLFCIAINPYKRFPIYTQRVMEMYAGKRRNESPPHIFAVAEESYQGLIDRQKNQSILITGESGAGKTENTKKVIAYFASIGGSGKKKDGEIGLEEKIVQTNPVLEGWGNAKTVRNDNSSRFGKFIRIWFNHRGKLSGSDMVIYLLEKSRLTFQAELERSYHSFYMLITGAVTDIQTKCLLSSNIYDYWWVSQGKIKVDSIDDYEEMELAHQAYGILGFKKEEVYDIYRLTAVVMHMGNFSKDFVPVGKEEQAEVKYDINASKIADICGVDVDVMSTYFCKPKLKVGGEWVFKGQSCAVAAAGVAGIARKIYELVFRFIVDRCNENLIDPNKKKAQYIGCLDIAGFEIFDFNGFEQICINFCNEKLQQFFNDHQFLLEQDEYVKEGITWKNVDFGMNLERCITMFEKPMGLLAILEEESLFPKATDQTLAAKLMENLYLKCENFHKANKKSDPGAHFSIIHYAGTVSYNLTGWLEKNKDPLNDTIIEVMKNGSNKLLVQCFIDHPGQPLETKKSCEVGSKKKGGGKTVSSFYKYQLDDLMKTLYATNPSFIRCMVPNTHKQPGVVDPGLIMHQYRCNGVLAGIAICHQGFPNKFPYPDFKERYQILAIDKVSKAKDDKAACNIILDHVNIEGKRYQLGHTKVFFRGGTVGRIEELRAAKIGTVLSLLTAVARGKASRIKFQKMAERKMALVSIQRTLRSFLLGKHWKWWDLFLRIKPKLKGNNFESRKEKLEVKLNVAAKNMNKVVVECAESRKEHKDLMKEKNKYALALKDEGRMIQDAINKTKRLEKMQCDLQKQVDEAQKRLKEEESIKESVLNQNEKVMQEKLMIQEEFSKSNGQIQKMEEEQMVKDDQIIMLKEELQSQDDVVKRLKRETSLTRNQKEKAEENLQLTENQSNHIKMMKTKVEESLDTLDEEIQHEKICKGNAEKMRRKVENDLRLVKESIQVLSHSNLELASIVHRQDKEMASHCARIENEKNTKCKYIKQEKELTNRLKEIDRELDEERANRTKAEQARSFLSRDIDDLSSRLEEAGNKTSSQIENGKRRDVELGRLKSQLEESSISHETMLAGQRQKHNNMITEMKENIDALNKTKNKSEHDKGKMERDLNELKINLEKTVQEKQGLEREMKSNHLLIVESQRGLDQLLRAINEADVVRNKLHAEGQDLERQKQELKSSNFQLGKEKVSLTAQLENVKKLADVESREKSSLLSKFRHMANEIEGLNDRINEESLKKSDLIRALSKAQSDIQLWKSMYEIEGVARIEELEDGKNKLVSRIQEEEDKIELLVSNVNNQEKDIQRMKSNIDEAQQDYEKANAAAIIIEQRSKSYDKVFF